MGNLLWKGTALFPIMNRAIPREAQETIRVPIK